MLASIDLQSISVWIHVSAALVGFGSTFTGALIFPLALQMDKKYLPFAHRVSLAVSRRFAEPALVIVLVTGIFQVAHSDSLYSFSDAWVSATFVIVIVLGGLLGAYFVPTDRKLGAQVEREIAAAGDGEIVLSDSYTKAARLESQLGALAGLLVIVAIFLMVTKPGQ